MKRNIETAGRIARAVTGLLCLAGGVACWWAGWPATAGRRWVALVLLVVAGLFQLYEAKKGWCVARACGLRTPL